MIQENFNVLWSKAQGVFHIETMKDTTSTGLRMFRENKSSGYDLIASGLTHVQAHERTRELQSVIDKRTEDARLLSQVSDEAEEMREMTELAAKAAGMQVEGWTGDHSKGMRLVGPDHEFIGFWNPRFNDADSMALAKKLQLRTGFDDRFKDLGPCAYCTYETGENSLDSIMVNIEEAGGRYAAHRLAVLKAAAELESIKQNRSKK